MALRLSTGARNAIANLVGGWFDSGTLEIYSGAQPASPNNAPSGTLLASISLPADAFAAASNGAVALQGTWEDSSANGTGTAGWFRFVASGDSGGSSTTAIRVDGAVTATGGGGELELVNTSLVTGQPVQITSFTFTMPAG